MKGLLNCVEKHAELKEKSINLFIHAMKKLLFIITLVMASVVAPHVAHAQFRYGPTAGLTLSTLKFKQDLMTVKGQAGFSAGIAGELMFPGVGFGVDFGLGYEMLGAKTNLGEKPMWADQGFADPRVYLHYISIPFHLRFKYTRMNGFEDYLAPFVYVGPNFGIRAAHSSCEAYDFSGGDLSMDFGVGAEIMRNWQVSACYQWGLTYSMKAKILTNFSARNSVWNIRVAYFF